MRPTFQIISRALLAALLAGVFSMLVGAPAVAQGNATVTGEVLYRERIALPPSARVIIQLQDVSFADAAATVLAEQIIDPAGKGPPYAFQLTYDAAKIDSRFSYAVRAQIKDGDTLLFTTTERYAVITQGNPVSGIRIIVNPVGAPTPQEQLCFSETGHCASGRFLSFWRQNGGMAVFGLPLTDLMTENNLPVQYFERQRFELHAENAAPYDVLLGRLGDELLRQRSIDWLTLPSPTGAQAGCRFFPETQHNICDQSGGPDFLNYWSANGLEFDGKQGKSPAESLALFGLPLTEPMTMTLEGQPFLVQWLERARFEWNPDNPAAYRVLLGRLGAEVQNPPLDQTPVALPAPSPVDITLTNSDDGRAIGLKAGQMLAVRLDSNPSTGYSWQVGQVDDAVLKQQGEPQFIQPADAPPGAGGAQVFRFTAVAAGQTTLTLVYKRSFEPNVAPVQTFTVQVTVEAGAP